MLLVLLSVVMGGSFFFNGIALREFPTLSIVTARVGLAALALMLLMRILGQSIQLNRQLLKAFFGMSFLNNVVPFSLIVWGQQHIASGVASILNATTPLFTMLAAHWFTTDEKINPRRLLGVLTGMGGVGLMMGLDSMESWDSTCWVNLPFSLQHFPTDWWDLREKIHSIGNSASCNRYWTTLCFEYDPASPDFVD